MKSIFLDYNSTTPVADEVLSYMMPYFNKFYGNASSMHSFGQKALHAIDLARTQAANLINANPDEIIFTGGGTEANNLAILGFANQLKTKGKHIIISSVEHSSVYRTCNYLEDSGFTVTRLPVDKTGLVGIDDLEKSIRKDTILISIILANNETGVIQNISELSKIVRKYDICFHSDAVQALGKVSVDVKELGVDMLSISAHKIYGPKGVGALYVKRGTTITPIIYGGGQEKKLRSGTENVPSIAGFGKACEIVLKNFDGNVAHLERIRNSFEQKIRQYIPDIKINSSEVKRVPNTSSVTFTDISSDALIVRLDLNGIAVSSGSACGSGSIEPSKTLKAIGLSKREQLSTLRFSFGLYNTEDDIEYVVRILNKLLNENKIK